MRELLLAIKKQFQKGYVELVLAVVGLLVGLWFVFSPTELMILQPLGHLSEQSPFRNLIRATF